VRNAPGHLADRAQPFAPLHRGLRGTALREVVQDGDEDRPGPRVRSADGEVQRNPATVRPPPLDLAPLTDDAALSRGEVTVHVAIVPCRLVLGHEHADAPTFERTLRMAEQAAGGCVAAQDAALRVGHHDRIDRRGEKRVELGRGSFGRHVAPPR
jgi:hypothetical protein